MFLLKDAPEEFFNGSSRLEMPSFNDMTNEDKYYYLAELILKGAYYVKQKIGLNNQFRDRIELNQILRKPNLTYDYRLEKRKGYPISNIRNLLINQVIIELYINK